MGIKAPYPPSPYPPKGPYDTRSPTIRLHRQGSLLALVVPRGIMLLTAKERTRALMSQVYDLPGDPKTDCFKGSKFAQNLI